MKFKDDVVASRFDQMHSFAQRLAAEMDDWCKVNYGIELTLTETFTTKEEDEKVNRVSDTHRTGRAFDVRTRDLPESLIAELCAHFRKKYYREGAFSKGHHNLIVYRPHGTGPHLHVQLKRSYLWQDLKDQKTNQPKT